MRKISVRYRKPSLPRRADFPEGLISPKELPPGWGLVVTSWKNIARIVTGAALSITKPGSFDCAHDAFAETMLPTIRRATMPATTLFENVHTDDQGVDRFAALMKAKLAASRAKGRAGWETCTEHRLISLLHEHLEKGDMRDVAIIAMMIHLNREGASHDR